MKKLSIVFVLAVISLSFAQAQRVRPRITPKLRVSKPKPVISRATATRSQTAKQLANALKTPNVRGGKQARLRSLANEPKLSNSVKSELQRDIRAIKQGKRKTIRVPKGYNLVHPRGQEAAKGYGYQNAQLNLAQLHRTQHKYDRGGRLQRHRPR